MKKFLSLVLALVMTMSLVTISAGATDFTDDSKIQYEAAVKVMDMLDVVGGYSDGTFRPANNLTRGAAAKIITNIKLTPAVADALKGSETPFKDVPATNVFSGAIAYCASEGIISGYADGTFRPAGTLTGNAFMKMLIGVLGYDTTDYTGKNFATKVALKVKQLGLAEGTTFVGAKAATREEACLYAFNALYLPTVYYTGGSSVTINGAVIAVGAEEHEDDPLAKAFNLAKPVDDTDAFGRPATKYVAGKKSVTIADAAELTYTGAVTAKKLADDLGLAKKDTLKVNNVVLAKDSTVLTGAGVNTVTYIYANADGSYKAVIVDYQKTTVSKVNPANVKNETARNIELTAVKSATYDTEKFAVNDVVLYVYNANGIVDVVAPETIEGSVSSMSKTGATVVINGKTYANAASLTLNSKGTFYLSLDGTTIIDAAAVTEVTSDQYAYIYQIVKTNASTGYDDNGMPVITKDSYKAYFVKADGTLGSAPIAGEALKGKVIPYTLNAQGVMVQAKPATGVSANSDFASAKLGKNTRVVNGYYMSDDTAFVFVDITSGKLVYSKATGYKSVEEMTADAFVVGNATTKQALTVFVKGTAKAAETAANYAFLQTTDPETSLDADGVTVLYTYKVLLQGEKEPTTLVAKGEDKLATYGLGARFEYTVAGGYLSTVKPASATVREAAVNYVGAGYIDVTPKGGQSAIYELATGFVAYLNDGTALSVDALKVGDTVNCYLDNSGKISVAVIYPRAD